MGCAPLVERLRLALEYLRSRHADDRVVGLRRALRGRDLSAFARDAELDERTLRSFVNDERPPRAGTLEKIELGLLNYGDPATAPCWTAEWVERSGLDPADPFCRGLIVFDELVDELERKVADVLSGARWPSHPVTKASLKKARQRERRVSS